MAKQWRDDQPIYRQLQQEVCALIIKGAYPEGSALPSVRQLSGDLGINHLTVAKAYQELVGEQLIEKRRGLGMFVAQGALATLQAQELKKFSEQELPGFAQRMHQLKVPLDDAIAQLRETYESQKKKEEDQ